MKQSPNVKILFKYQATGNDFLLCGNGLAVPDYTVPQVASLCDRHFGFGADGLIRAVLVNTTQAEKLSGPDWETRPLLGEEIERETASFIAADYVESGGRDGSDSIATYMDTNRLIWFMDYYNADGSIAQMCGNGVRVFAAYLEDQGLCLFNEHQPIPIATRGGIKYVRKIGENYQVQMGKPRAYRADSHRLETNLGIVAGTWVEVPNPHVVALLVDEEELNRAELPQNTARQLPLSPIPEGGANVEMIVLDIKAAVIQMRVSERGVGETLSCGTGCCAAAYHAYRLFPARRRWQVNIPGGQVVVEIDDNEELRLTGPAKLIGEVRAEN